MTAPHTPTDQVVSLSAGTGATLGQFVYRDLMTTDVAGARAFYSALFGWQCTPRDLAGVPYTDVTAAGRPLGGMVALGPGHGASHWTGYVEVDDVEAACARATAAGGTLFVPPHDIPGGAGRFAVLGDPTGAVVSMARFTGEGAAPEGGAPAGGTGGTGEGGAWWHELLTTDVPGAAAFYGAVFGWEARPDLTLPGGGTYHTFTRAGHMVGGMMQPPPGVPASTWQLYFWVADVDAAVARALALGGAVTWPAMDVPDVGRVAGLADSAGAIVAAGTPAAMG